MVSRLAATQATCKSCILVPLFVYVLGFTWEDIVDWNDVLLQGIEPRKYLGKDSWQGLQIEEKVTKLVDGRTC